MFELLAHDFIVRAIVIGYACAIVTAIFGNFLVAGRQAIMPGMLAHTSLAGVGIGVLLGISPSISAVIIAILASLLLYGLGKNRTVPQEAVSVLILSGGMAIALLCVHFAKDSPVALETYLFGSILTVTTMEMWSFIAVSLVMVLIVTMFYNRFLCLIFDRDFFYSRFRYQSFFEILFMVMIGVLVALSLKIIGGLLVGSLLVIPTLTAQYIARSFRASIMWSVVFNIVGVTVGILASLYWDVPASSGIILSLICIFFVALFVRRFSR